MSKLFQYFKESFFDKSVSRAENKALGEALKTSKNTRRTLSILRAQVFNLAKENIKSSKDQKVVEWLEDSMKILWKNLPKIEASRSAFFSPGPDCQQNILKCIHASKKSIKICVFTISDDDIYHALLKAQQRKVKITIITDNDKKDDRGSDVQKLADAGIPVFIDKTRHHMHHKFAIFDQKILLNGSYNWTRSAYMNNHENITLQEDPYLVDQFSQEFDRLLPEMEALT